MKSKKNKWDGRSRIPNDLFRKNYNEIFGKKEEDELKESHQQSIKNKKDRQANMKPDYAEMEEYLKELKHKL
jgi:hypothetical protein|tara:strand:- start:195 stop:410 length:216 start_codon:yes stop_codon:yes gene_type:complete